VAGQDSGQARVSEIMPMIRPRVFVSYSHRDKSVLESLLPYLETLEREKRVTVWSDDRIRGGERWHQEIDAALNSAAVAILLISQEFLASAFVRDEELPRILERQAQGHLTVLPVFVSPSTVRSARIPIRSADGTERHIVLSEFEGFGTPDKTLSEVNVAERQRLFVDLHDRIRALSAGPGADRQESARSVHGVATVTPSSPALRASIESHPESHNFLPLRLRTWTITVLALVAAGFLIVEYVPFDRLFTNELETRTGPLDAKVTAGGGKYMANDLLNSLASQSGQVVLDGDLVKTLEHKVVTIPDLTDVSLKAAMDLIFNQVGVQVDYSTVNETVVVKAAGASR
jgi:hypothetical protein